MRLLVVEDEQKAGEYIRKGLTESGFIVDLATTGPDGLHAATVSQYDLIVLDVMLPGLDGWQVISELRKTIDTPVLFLTARDGLDDRVKGLELGADDYLVKPFAFVELLVRIRTLLRRGPTREPDLLHVADLELDAPKRRVIRAGIRIDLTAKEFALCIAAEARRSVLSRPLIASQVWDMNFDSTMCRCCDTSPAGEN
jgi:two-component system copper resistance phosphate regulon response regulator CusR